MVWLASFFLIGCNAGVLFRFDVWWSVKGKRRKERGERGGQASPALFASNKCMLILCACFAPTNLSCQDNLESPSIELCYDELRAIILDMGFVFVKEEYPIESPYITFILL
jgi:hypothetical protein